MILIIIIFFRNIVFYAMNNDKSCELRETFPTRAGGKIKV